MDHDIEVQTSGLRCYIKSKEMIIVKTDDNRVLALVKCLGDYLVFPAYTDIVSPQKVELVRNTEEVCRYLTAYQLTEADSVVVTKGIAQEIRSIL